MLAVIAAVLMAARGAATTIEDPQDPGGSMPAPYGSYLQQPVRCKVGVIGDSNVVFSGSQLLQAAQRYPNATPTPTISVDFIAAVPGIGLRDLTQLLTRLADSKLALDEYDAVLINLGVNDIILENANWNNFFAGTYPSPGGKAYRQRVVDLLAAIPSNVRVYWLGIPSGITKPEVHFLEVAAVDIALAGFDFAWHGAVPADPAAQTRFHYIHADSVVSLIVPRFVDGLHYTPAAAAALYDSVVARIVADQP